MGEKEVHKKLDTILVKQSEQGESLARIDEHLKTINGTLVRHEQNFTSINEEHTSFAKWQGSVNARLAIVGIGGTGSIVGTLIVLAQLGLI